MKDVQTHKYARYWNILRSSYKAFRTHKNPHQSMLHITKRVYDLPDEQKYVHILTEITTGKIPETRLSED